MSFLPQRADSIADQGPIRERLFPAPLYEDSSATPPVFTGFLHRRELLTCSRFYQVSECT